MNIALIMTAVQQGAVVANHVEVQSLHKDMDGSGKHYGARVQDKLIGKTWDVRAKACAQFTRNSQMLTWHTLGHHQCYRAFLGRPLDNGQPCAHPNCAAILGNTHHAAKLLFPAYYGSSGPSNIRRARDLLPAMAG